MATPDLGAAGAPLTSEVAGRWTAAAVPWWVPRVVLPVAWLATLTASFNATEIWGACTPEDPCGPSLAFSLAAVLLLATPVLLWWTPRLGCAVGATFALLDVAFLEPGLTSRLEWAGFGALCLLVLFRFRAATARQRALVRGLAADAGTFRPPRKAPPNPPVTERSGGAVLLVLVALGLGLWYSHQTSVEAEHAGRAIHVDAEITAVDTESGTITVRLPDGVGRVITHVYEPYAPGDQVAVSYDARDTEWARLVGEPADHTPWLIGALLAGMLCVVLVRRDRDAYLARAALLAGPQPALRVVVAGPDNDEGARPWVWVWSADAAPGDRPLARFHTQTRLPPAPQPALIVGDVRDGGWAAVAADDTLVLPDTPIQAYPDRYRHRSTAPILDPAARPGPPFVEATPATQLPADLPWTLTATRQDRTLGILEIAGVLVAAPALFLLFDDHFGLVETMFLGLGCLARLHAGRLRLSFRLVLHPDHLVVRGAFREQQVPWHDVEVGFRDEKLVITWGPDTELPVRRFAQRSVDEIAATAAALRDRAKTSGASRTQGSFECKKHSKEP